jgi:hypothetical protein
VSIVSTPFQPINDLIISKIWSVYLWFYQYTINHSKMLKYKLWVGTLTLFYSRGVLHLCYKTLVTYQVTNDHGLSCRHKLNTSSIRIRLVNVRTTKSYNFNPSITTTTSWMDQDTTTLGVVFRWIQFSPLGFRWTCIIQRHHTRSCLVYYITRKH